MDLRTLFLVIVPILAAGVASAAPPATKKNDVTDTYHGTSVIDGYRWLEDGASKDVQSWSDAQNDYARGLLDKLPGVDQLRSRLKEILTAKKVSHGSLEFRNGQLFAIRREPPKEQPFLVVMPSPEQPDKARTLVDPGEIDKKGTTAIDWFVPSPDGSLVAVSLSKGGSESGDVHIFETATGKQMHEVIPRVHGGTAGGDLAWTPDGKGFFYTRYPLDRERPAADMDFYQQLFYHELGTPIEKDRHELGKDQPRVAEFRVDVDQKTGHILAVVQDGDSGRFAHYFRPLDGTWKQFAKFEDGVVQAVFGPGDSLYLVSRKDSPRGKVLRLNVKDLDLAKATVVIPEGKETLVTNFYDDEGLTPTANRLYAVYQLGGPSEVRVFDFDGKPLPTPEQLRVATANGVMPLQGDDVLFANGSFVDPVHWFHLKADGGKTVRTSLNSDSPVDFKDVRVEREFAVSKDGTKVPVTILIPKGAKLDGSDPCLVTGYGGYAINIEPSLSADRRVLFDHGFVVAVANLRGGAEYGEEWHRAGNLTNKQNVFDDFAAVLKHLIDRKYTSPEKLAIRGGSNGGLLMGATLTQHPELAKAVVSHVGIYDMLRVELSPNGAFNVPEFGSIKDAEQFKALRAYSPFHNVKDDVKYPAVLFLTGANDPRVDPMHSRKMTARLQTATASSAPILLRTSASSGHGLDTSLSERIEELVDVYAFIFDQLGVKVRP